MNEVRVIEIRPICDGRPLKAFVDIQVGDWIIYEWRIIKKDGQRTWVSVPMASWKDLDHKVRYRALLSIPDELRQRIEVAILSAWEKENADETEKRQ
jgi:DNA-binding cell septation regulator SpoVG